MSELVERTRPKFENGEIKVRICATFPMEKTDEGHQLLYRGENVGKVVLTLPKK